MASRKGEASWPKQKRLVCPGSELTGLKRGGGNLFLAKCMPERFDSRKTDSGSGKLWAGLSQEEAPCIVITNPNPGAC